MWRLTVADRLSRWKAFRNEIGAMPIEQALDATAELWNRVPFTPYYLDYDRPDTWPDPWTLIAENYYCDIAKCLGMLYTLHLSEHRHHDLALRIYKLPQPGAMYNLVWIDQGKYVLNLEPEQHVNKKSIPKELKEYIQYSSTELKLDRY